MLLPTLKAHPPCHGIGCILSNSRSVVTRSTGNPGQHNHALVACFSYFEVVGVVDLSIIELFFLRVLVVSRSSPEMRARPERWRIHLIWRKTVMSEKLVCMMCMTLLLGLTAESTAADYKDWDNGDPTSRLWSSPANWDPDGLPTMLGDTGNRTRIEPGSGGGLYPILDATVFDVDPNGAFADRLYVAHGAGDGSVAEFWVVDGARLTIGDDLNIAYNADSHGICYVDGSATVIDIGDDVKVGRRGEGILMMNGGTMNVSGTVEIPSGTDTTSINVGHLQLNGGVINCDNLLMRPVNSGVIGTGTLDVHAGTLRLEGDAVPLLEEYIDNGWITAYDAYGGGTLHWSYDPNDNNTALTAISRLNPTPADGSVSTPGDLELSWVLPDPCVPGQPVLVDVYITDDFQLLKEFTDPEAIRIVSGQNVTSVSVQTQPKKRYYWAVDTYLGGDDPNDNPVLGPIFSFYTDNLAPHVEAGADIVTWLQDGVRVGHLGAAVTDEDAYTVQWTVVSEPNEGTAIIETPTEEDTSVTLTALGVYVLQLEAFDGEYAGSDTVTITVYSDSCEAAQSQPGYVPLVGDLNGDCKVDDADLALLQENWLKDNSSIEEWFESN